MFTKPMKPIESVIAHPSEREMALQAENARKTKAAVNKVRQSFGKRLNIANAENH